MSGWAGTPLDNTRRMLTRELDAHGINIYLDQGESRRGAAEYHASAVEAAAAEVYACIPADSDSGTATSATDLPAEPAALLDTRGISVQACKSVQDSGRFSSSDSEWTSWQKAVGHQTHEHRMRKASDLRKRARGKRALARAVGLSRDEVQKAGKWHSDRAKGQEFRTQNVIHCADGVKALTVTCNACGTVGEPHPLRCGVGLLCVSCRGRLASARRAQVARSRDAVLSLGKRLGLARYRRRNGRWTEKLVTLTLPHRPEDGIAERIGFVRKAWPHFRKALRTWLETVDHDGEHAHFYAAHEWTAGDDRQGHPHVHFWFWGPFLDLHVVRDLWRAALEKAGFGDLELHGRRFRHVYRADLVVDAKQVKPGPGGMYEVIKYIVKDLEHGERIDARLFGEVYKALDGKRTHMGSRGFLKLGEQAARCACGAEGCFSTRIVEVPPSPLTMPLGGREPAPPAPS